jgi:hypothetical protein
MPAINGKFLYLFEDPETGGVTQVLTDDEDVYKVQREIFTPEEPQDFTSQENTPAESMPPDVKAGASDKLPQGLEETPIDLYGTRGLAPDGDLIMPGTNKNIYNTPSEAKGAGDHIVPANVRAFLGFKAGTLKNVDEKFFNRNELQVLRDAVKSSMADFAKLPKPKMPDRFSMDKDLGPKDMEDLRKWQAEHPSEKYRAHSGNKQFIDYDNYPNNWTMKNHGVFDWFTDPSTVVQTTVGGAMVEVQPNGDIVLTDKYDFDKGRKIGDPFLNKLHQQGESTTGSVPVRINLGNPKTWGKEKTGAATNPVVPVIASLAEKHGVDPTYAVTIAQIESKMNPAAKNKRSSAGGLFQFINSTWKGFGAGGDRFDPDHATAALSRLTTQNQAQLKSSLGREATPGELYLAHQQGAGGAARLLKSPEKNVVDVLLPVYRGNRRKAAQAVRLNGGHTTMTAGEFAHLWTNRYEKTRLGLFTNEPSRSV